MNPLITETLLLIAEKLGKDPTPEKVVHVLHGLGIANDVDLRAYVIGSKFFTMYGSTTRTARDIEEELAAQYNITREAVYSIRVRYARGAKRLPLGRPQKA